MALFSLQNKMSYELLLTIVICETLVIIFIIVQSRGNSKDEGKASLPHIQKSIRLTYNMKSLGKALSLSKKKRYEESIQIYEGLLSY